MIATKNKPSERTAIATTDRRANAAKKTLAERRNFILAGVADQCYALPLSTVQEVLAAPELSTPPGLPPTLDGFMNLAGRAVAVVNLARLFGLPVAPPSLHTPIVVVRNARFPLGFRVEQLLGTASISDSEIARLSSHDTSNDAVVGVAMVGERCVAVLSPDRLFLREERTRLVELQSLAQRRLDSVREGNE